MGWVPPPAPSGGGGGGGATTINGLDDVNAATPTDGDSLVWDDGTSRWVDEQRAAADHTHDQEDVVYGEQALAVTTGTPNVTDAPDIDTYRTFTFTVEGDANDTQITNPTGATPTEAVRILFVITGNASATGALTVGTAFRFGDAYADLSDVSHDSATTSYVACVYDVTDDKWDIVSVAGGYG